MKEITINQKCVTLLNIRSVNYSVLDFIALTAKNAENAILYEQTVVKNINSFVGQHWIPLVDSRWGQSGHAPIMVLGSPPPPHQAAEGTVKRRWIMEISQSFCLLRSRLYEKYNMGVYIATENCCLQRMQSWISSHLLLVSGDW